jgi:hypothetical protein
VHQFTYDWETWKKSKFSHRSDLIIYSENSSFYFANMG